MKSRTSYFNGTLFKKDLTRFAPAWAVYFIMLLMDVVVIAGESSEYRRCLNLADFPRMMAMFNLAYAFLLGALLFGDLFNARHCNMIHALPLRRETIFGTNLAAALACSAVPNLAACLMLMPFLGEGWMISLYCFAALELQFLFFFGTAVFSVMLAGNRLAMTAVYVFVNFLSLLLLWFAKTLFAPLMFGIRVISDLFYRTCPCLQMTTFYTLIDVDNQERVEISDIDGTVYYRSTEDFTVSLGAGWGYLAICAVIGIMLMVIALQLYRRRKLESAGDFMAVKQAEPVFLVLFTLGVGAFFQLFSELFVMDMEYLFLAVGIVVGFFGGMMLLKKNTRVFNLKSFRNLGILAGCLALALFLTWADPLGFSRRVPEVDQVASVEVGTSYASSETIWDGVTLTDPEDIEKIINVHKYAVGEIQEDISIEGSTLYLADVGIKYTLKNGSTISRYYSIPVPSTAGNTLRTYFSSIECLVDMSEEEFLALEDRIYYIWTDDSGGGAALNLAEMDVEGLLEAVIADCKAGNMVQQYPFQDQNECWYCTHLSLDYADAEGYETSMYLEIYSNCENTLNWLEENGLYREVE